MHNHQPTDPVLFNLTELRRDIHTRPTGEGLMIMLGTLHHDMPLVVVRGGLFLHRLEAHGAARLGRAGVANALAV